MSDYQVWNELGNVYIISNEPDKAVNAYRKALDLNPESGRAHNNIALAYIRLSQPETAIEHYQRSIELFKSFADKAEAWHRLGNAYQMLGDTKNTLLAFERATALAPERAEYRNSLTTMLETHLEAPKEELEEDLQEKEAFTESAQRNNNAFLDMDPEVRKRLIPIVTDPRDEDESEEENIDLDPGMEALMNELSREIEREVEPEALETPTALSLATDILSPEADTSRQPKWLVDDEDDDIPSLNVGLAETEEALPKETQIVDKIAPATAEEKSIETEAISDDLAEEIVTENAPVLLAEEIVTESAPVLLAEENNAEEDETLEDIEEEEEEDEEDDLEYGDADDDFEDEEDEEDEDDDFEDDEEDDFEDEDDEEEDELIDELAPVTIAHLSTAEVTQTEDQTEALMHNASVWGEMGNVFYTSDAYDGAAIAYRKALELDGNYGAVMHNLAMLHMQRGEYDQAVELYQKSIDALQDPAAQASSWNNLGHAYRALRDYDNAKEAYRKADELDTEHVAPKNWKCNELLSTRPA